MAITVYGIKNCDTLRKAIKWLNNSGVEHRFHDYRKDGLDEAQLRTWVDVLGWEQVLNKRGTTWRKLPESDRSDVNTDQAIALMLASPAMIKRPLLDLGDGRLHLGFKEAEYATLLKP